MRLNFHAVPTFPRLAWCVRLEKGSRAADVFHGPWVETREDRFFEGAWDGDFGDGNFDRAENFIGTGARVTDEGLLFAAPTELLSGVFSLRAGDEAWFSNSFANLLVQTGDSPDPGYTDYAHDFIHSRAWGIRPYHRTFPTANGNRVSIHLYSNLLVRSDLSRKRLEKNQPPQPETFEAYRALLSGAIAGMIENGASPGRKIRYTPVTAISRGYDSTCTAVLVREAGGRKAIAIRSPFERRPHHGDDGSEIAVQLGFDVIGRRLEELRELPPGSEAEFCAALPSGSGIPKRMFETDLEGSIFITGFSGDIIWSVDPKDRLPKMMIPAEKIASEPQSYTEFRLRAGFLHFAPAYIGSIHRVRLHEIARSAEMSPWWLPVAYNRPIPRRIGEEAGIPREAFGQVKQAGGALVLRADLLLPESRRDFLAFCDANGLPTGTPKRRIRPIDLITLPIALFQTIVRRFRLEWIYRRLAPLFLLADRRLLRRPAEFGYGYHWGFERVKGRYEWANGRIKFIRPFAHSLTPPPSPGIIPFPPDPLGGRRASCMPGGKSALRRARRRVTPGVAAGGVTPRLRREQGHRNRSPSASAGGQSEKVV